MSEGSMYQVKVILKDKPLKPSKEVLGELKGVVSGKMMARMKREVVNCPVLAREVPFLECFSCKNFIRRFKGEVHCAGSSL